MKKTLFLIIFWRIFITIAMIFGLALPIQMAFLGGGAKNYFISPLTWAWANFDGALYLSIAGFGYRQFEQAFFPLYPYLIHFIETITKGEYILIGMIISHLSIILAIIVFYKLVQIDLGKKAIWVVLFLLFFPTSFYFGSIYTESLFLLLIVTSFYAARKKMWWLAGICGALASATRIVGVFLLPALLVEFYLSSRALKNPIGFFSVNESRVYPKNSLRIFRNLSQIKSVEKDSSTPHHNFVDVGGSVGMTREWLWLLLIPIGLFIYMYWLNQNYHDPLYFFHAQSAFSAGRSGSGFILLPQVMFRYLKIFLTAKLNYQYLISFFEFVTSMGIIGLLIYGYKKMRPSYWVFTFFCFIVPTLTGTFLSMPRFTVTIFPLFIFLTSILKTNRSRIFVLSFFLLLLFVATMLYTRGYWIA